MNEKGMCKKHGEFILAEGCPGCLAEARAEWKTKTKILCMSEEGCQYQKGAYCEGGPPDCAFAEKDNKPLVMTSELIEKTATSTPEISAAEPVPTAIVRVKPEQDIEVQSFYNQALSLLEYADERVISTVDDLKPATEDLSIIAKVKKALEEKKREYLKPLQDHIKEVNETFKALFGPIEQADKVTRGKILAFQLKQKLIREEEERINALRLEAAQKEMELKGELTESVDLVEVSPEAPKRISTDTGTVGQRDNWKWEVVDFALVPDDYKMINAGVLTPIVKASKGKITISGIRIYNEPIIAVNAR